MKILGSDQPNERLTINELKQHLINMLRHNWKNQLRTSTGKMRLYKRIKNTFNYENYLELPFYLRNPLTKFRISNHVLRIETGRFNLPPANWSTQIENLIKYELHFLFECDCYHDLQEHKAMISYFQSLNPNFDFLPNNEKWIFISTLNDPHTNYVLSSL